jgi:hypothetical protein
MTYNAPHKEAKTAIFAALNRLQFDPADRFILMRPLPIGLGGQISIRLEMLRLALALDRKAVFPFAVDKPYTQIFAPMNAPITLPEGDEPPEVDPCSDQHEAILSFDRMITGPEHFSETVNDKILARLQLTPISQMIMDGLILEWMTRLPNIQDAVENDRLRLGISDTTLGVHFRRGDKSVETAYVSADDFNIQIRAMHQHWPFSELFLASDDPTAVRQIIAPPGVRLIFDDTEQRFNNANHKMLIRSPDLAEQETHVAFKNIALLSQCGGIIGLDNAHFSTLSARAITARGIEADHVMLIDGRLAENRSRFLKIAFDIKRGIRAIARNALRRFTVRERLSRSEQGRRRSEP